MNETARQQSPSPILYLRSLLFWTGFVGLTLVYAVILFASLALPRRQRYRVTESWASSILGWLTLTCGLSYEVQGLENIGREPGIVLAKHQSTWETLALNLWFKPQAWVVKRELLWIPVFGWGMAMMQPIALDRSAGRRAADQLVEQGVERLRQRRWVIIFPEGTRTAAGVHGRYRIGGALLAHRSEYPVTPVAHNAGEYWPRRKFIKKPGVIQVRIGKPIDSRGKTASRILSEAEDWIETEMAAITTLAKHEHGGRKQTG